MNDVRAAPASLVGETFDCVFAEFAPRLTILSPTELHVRATIGTIEVDEVVISSLAGIRPGVFVMSWQERSGTFVVQVQDHQNKLVHNYARLPDGQLFCAQGTIRPVH
ncbi:MAG: hypothetical protein JNL61_03255 [Rhizobiaceae bacterium]|nr:hypothetical protein [Rhizobiaceae bacterium]